MCRRHFAGICFRDACVIKPEDSSIKKGKRESWRIFDDGDYGGEVPGRLVWEASKEALEVWEKENPVSQEDVKWEEERMRKQEKYFFA